MTAEKYVQTSLSLQGTWTYFQSKNIRSHSRGGREHREEGRGAQAGLGQGCACKAEIQPSVKSDFLEQGFLIKEQPWFLLQSLGDKKQMALIS